MLWVNEIFGPTIQGEGKTIGNITMFLRLTFCNLRCSFCDTSYVFKEGKKMSNDEILEKISKIKSLVITGGEPLLQQKNLISLISKLPNHWIEIETNGMIVPSNELIPFVSLFNCSPKYKLNKQALEIFSKINSIFKFVIQDDIDKVISLVEELKIDKEKVYLMPEGKTRKEQIEKSPQIIELCNRYGFRFSPRLHTLIWDNKCGV